MCYNQINLFSNLTKINGTQRWTLDKEYNVHTVVCQKAPDGLKQRQTVKKKKIKPVALTIIMLHFTQLVKVLLKLKIL